ncbi:unnamed protein product [Lampetra fluviatilis]
MRTLAVRASDGRGGGVGGHSNARESALEEEKPQNWVAVRCLGGVRVARSDGDGDDDGRFPPDTRSQTLALTDVAKDGTVREAVTSNDFAAPQPPRPVLLLRLVLSLYADSQGLERLMGWSRVAEPNESRIPCGGGVGLLVEAAAVLAVSTAVTATAALSGVSSPAAIPGSEFLPHESPPSCLGATARPPPPPGFANLPPSSCTRGQQPSHQQPHPPPLAGDNYACFSARVSQQQQQHQSQRYRNELSRRVHVRAWPDALARSGSP